jgi:hypothetical protein
MDRLRELVAKQNEIQEKWNREHLVDYWGPERLAGPDGRVTPMRDRLILSIFRAFGDIRLDGIGPEGFQQLSQYFALDELHFGDLPGSLDRLTERYFCVMHVEHWHIQQGSRNIPVAGIKGLSMWIMMHLFSNPEGTKKHIDRLLDNIDKPLLDPETNAPFLHKIIPVEVLPEPQDSVRVVRDEAQQEWVAVRAEMTKLLREPDAIIQFAEWAGIPLKERCAGHTTCRGVIQLMVANNTQTMGGQAAQNMQRMQIASLGASLAAQNAWNAQQNKAKMSWGNF